MSNKLQAPGQSWRYLCEDPSSSCTACDIGLCASCNMSQVKNVSSIACTLTESRQLHGHGPGAYIISMTEL